ncbi:MAG TPA: ABC transporter substrate-binding protein [Ktedonobacterales bacterium]|nr:ABC transporter substrate-binding protein [Ktedonobacterales bacterium]
MATHASFSRRNFLIGMAGAATSSVVAACGGGSSAPAPKPAPTAAAAAVSTAASTGTAGTVELAYWSQLQPETQRWKDNQVVIDAFMQANPGIKVTTEHPAFADFDTKLVTAARAGTPPDMSEVSDSFPQLAKGGYLAQLDQFAQDVKLDLKDYYEGKLQTCYVDGKLWALPITADCRGLWWNMNLLKDAGFDQPPTSWDQLVATAQKVTRGGVYGWGVQGGNQGFMICEQFSAFFIQNDGKIISDDQTKAMTDQPEWITGATYWQELTTKYKVTQPSAATDDQNATYALFAQGKLAMFPGGPWARAEIQRNNPNLTFGKDFSASVVPYPTGKHPGTCQGGWLHSIWTASKVQDAAKKLMAYYHTPENIAQEAANSMPTRRSATNFKPFNDPWYKPFWDTMPYALAPVPTMAAGAEISTTLYKLLQSMLLGQQTADQAGKAFAKDVNERILPRYVAAGVGSGCDCPEV